MPKGEILLPSSKRPMSARQNIMNKNSNFPSIKLPIEKQNEP